MTDNMTADRDRFVTARAKAFSTEPIGTYKFLIAPDGAIRVYDSLAGYYTTCHSLTPAAERRIRRLAAK